MAKKAIEKPAKRTRTGGSHTLASGISELLRSLGAILGNAYADDAPSETVTSLEAAKGALLDARKAVQA